jgi:acyl-CoA dehydrogenase
VVMLFTQDQLAVQALVKDWCHQKLLPYSKQLEKDKALLKEFWVELSELGLCGLQFPEEYGGAGLESTSYLLAIEEIAKISASLAVTLSVHTTVGILPIITYGTAAQKESYLPPMTAGRWIGAFGLTEPSAGSDAGQGKMSARREGDGYILNGEKIFITNAHLAQVFVMTARTHPEEKGPKGLSAFVLEKDTPGFTVQSGDEKLGLQGSDWGNLVCNGVYLPETQRLGAEQEGFKIFMNSLDQGRISIAALALGIAEAALEDSIRYVKERQQFGQTLSCFQATQFKLATMATEIEAARHLTYHAARLKEAGQPFSKEASMAKLYASETAMRCANEAVQLFGGYGYTTDFKVERYFRDAKSTEIVEGTSQIQRLVIAKSLL